MPFKNIVISGDILTGKTTLASALAEKLGWQYISIGEFFRRYSKSQKIPFYRKIFPDTKLDMEVDAFIRHQLLTNEHLVIEGHYQGWNARNISTAYRILLTMQDGSLKEHLKQRNNLPRVMKETMKNIVSRKKVIDRKFKLLYGDDDYLNPAYFHLVIDTSTIPKEETLELTLSALKEKGLFLISV